MLQFVQLASEGTFDEETGDLSTLGFWAGLFRFRNPDRIISLLTDAAFRLGLRFLSEDEEDRIRNAVGVVIAVQEEEPFGASFLITASFLGRERDLEEAWENAMRLAEDIQEGRL